MDNEVKEFLAALQKKLVSIDYIKTEDIPNIGLYMDQVVVRAYTDTVSTAATCNTA